MNDFGSRLKMLREMRELPLSKLAEDIGTTKSALSRYENGKMEPGLSVMIRLAEYFNVTLDWLAGNGDDEDYKNISFGNKEASVKRQSAYYEAFNKCLKKDISPEKLNQVIDMIDILKK
jgi:transcriptional regulator with XRE-family HTH domain